MSEASGWRPIETAPKMDAILLWSRKQGIVIGWWEYGKEYQDSPHFNDWSSGREDGGATWDGGFKRIDNPTHWMPLPAPPTV